MSASTTEFEITKHLYKNTDVTAAKNVGRVMAQRCLEAGITQVRWEVKKGDLRKQRVMLTSVSLFILHDYTFTSRQLLSDKSPISFLIGQSMVPTFY